jgi:hypothetical protein
MGTKANRLRVGRTAALAGAAVALAACQPIVYDLGTNTTKYSEAQWRAVPIEIAGHGHGIQVRMRGCNNVTLTFDGIDPPHDPFNARLRPIATVTDATGKVIFNNVSPIFEVLPSGWKMVDTQDEGLPDTIDIPVGAAKGALKVEAGCTSYPGYGSGGGFTWMFPTCTTSTRTCERFEGGTPSFTYPYP